MSNPSKSATLARAASGLGVHEHPSGSNRTPFNQWFYGRMVAAAWCAIYVCWILIGAGWKIKKNAGADELGQQQIDAGWKKIAPKDIDSGDLVIYNFSHIGMCKARLANGMKRVYEGNHGDMSTTVDRPISDIRYGVRPPYGPETIPTPKPIDVPTGHHTAYIVHGNSAHISGKLTNQWGTERHPAPGVTGIVYPAPELGSAFRTVHGDLMVPIRWGGTNSTGAPNNGWYRYDYLRWAN